MAHSLRQGQVSVSLVAYPLKAPWPPSPQIYFCESPRMTAGVLQSVSEEKSQVFLRQRLFIPHHVRKGRSVEGSGTGNVLRHQEVSVLTIDDYIVCMHNTLHIFMLIFADAV